LIPRLAFFLLTLFSPFIAQGVTLWEGEVKNGFSVSISTPSQTIAVDQQVVLEIFATSPKGYHVNKESLITNLLDYLGYGPPPFTLFSEKEEAVNEKTQKITVILNAEMVGSYELTFRAVIFNSEAGSQVLLPTGVFPITVTAVVPEPQFQGYPAKMLALTSEFPVNLTFSNRINFVDNPQVKEEQRAKNEELFKERQFPWRAVNFFVFLISAVLFVRYFYFAIRRKNEEQQRVKTAKEKALSVLEAIQVKDYEQFYVDLTNTVRGYLEEVTEFDAPTLTTQEFLEELSLSSSLDESTKTLLSQFLTSADQVKFARHAPSDDECKRALDSAKKLIEST
jgi:hypothetical protein